jgi:hypothetical protein|tara:strand:- start:65 stop:556 length:492 start_codon:yes stop_codon:yes gene_type:complete
LSIFNNKNKYIPVSFVYYKFTLDNKVIPLKDEEGYLETFSEYDTDDEHQYIGEQLNTKTLELRSVSCDADGVLINQIFNRLGVEKTEKVNTYFTAYMRATFPRFLEENEIDVFYGNIIFRVMLNGYDQMYLDLYSNEMQPKVDRVYDEAISQLDALKKLTGLI